MASKDLTEAAIAKLEEFARLGWNNRRIAIELGVQPAVVAEYLSAHPDLHKERTAAARAAGPSKTTSKDLEPKQAALLDMVQLFEENTPVQEIARQVGLATSTTRKMLNKFYAGHFEKNRSSIAGSQYADIQMMKEEMLEFILKDAGHELVQFVKSAEAEGTDLSDSAKVNQLIEKAFNKGRKSFDTKAKAMEVYLKLLDREAKLSGVDAATNVNVNHRVKVEPQAIELLQRLQQTQEIVDGEVVADDTVLELGDTA